MTKGDPYLDSEDSISGNQFVKNYVKTKPVVIPRSELPLKEMLKRCEFKDEGYQNYLVEHRFTPESENVLKKLFDRMRHYIYTYDADNDVVRMATKTVKIILTDKVVTTSTASIANTELTQEFMTKAFTEWNIKSFYKTKGIETYQRKKSTVDIPVSEIKTNLYQSMVINKPHNLNVVNYINKRFPDSVVRDKDRFLKTLYEESPVFYQLLIRLSKRSGKLLIYASTRSSFDSEIWGLLMSKYERLTQRTICCYLLPTR